MPVEVAKAWNPKLYPELEEAGGLPQALHRALAALPGDLVPSGLDASFIVYAGVKRASRSSQTMIAAAHRAFSVDFWDRGVQYGSGWPGSLDDVAHAIVAFQVDGVSAAALGRQFSWIQLNEQAEVHEAGPAAFVDYSWEGYRRWLVAEPPGSREGRLLPLALACMSRPRLRRLMPFTSHDRLCFSRTTGYPYTSECPPAYPVSEGVFRIEPGVLDGDAATVAARLEAVVPVDCGPAVHGTADDLT